MEGQGDKTWHLVQAFRGWLQLRVGSPSGKTLQEVGMTIVVITTKSYQGPLCSCPQADQEARGSGGLCGGSTWRRPSWCALFGNHSCHNAQWLKGQKVRFPWIWRPECPRSRCWQGWLLLRPVMLSALASPRSLEADGCLGVLLSARYLQ